LRSHGEVFKKNGVINIRALSVKALAALLRLGKPSRFYVVCAALHYTIPSISEITDDRAY